MYAGNCLEFFNLFYYLEFRSGENVTRRTSNIWEAAKAFNEKFNIKSWVIHHDVSLPTSLFRLEDLAGIRSKYDL